MTGVDLRSRDEYEEDSRHDCARSRLVDPQHDSDHEDTGEWLLRLLWIADDLDPTVQRHPYYDKILLSERGDSRRMKLRTLIEHPETGVHEREAAVAALARLKR